MRVNLLLFLLAILYSEKSFSNDLVIKEKDTVRLSIKGLYKGFDVYIQNPLNSDSTFCTYEVYLDKKKIPYYDRIESSAYEISLSHLNMYDTFNLEIYHAEGCEPKVANPGNIDSDSFLFKSAKLIKGLIIFTTWHDNPGDLFVIRESSTDSIISVIPAEGKARNKYQCKINIVNKEISYSIRRENSKKHLKYFPNSIIIREGERKKSPPGFH